jgi:hypothetical protein
MNKLCKTKISLKNDAPTVSQAPKLGTFFDEGGVKLILC